MEEARAYEELRVGFTAAVSHELRTPLARLLALLESASLPDADRIGRVGLVPGQPRGFQTDMFAQTAEPSNLTRASEWLSLPPASDLSVRLSASAVQTYETCPLQFKLEREWKIPGEVPAAMQYGGVIHRALLAFYDSVRAQRPMTDEAVVQLFRDELSAAQIQDHYQHDLYLKQGIEQLQDFLRAFRRAPQPRVLHTEEFFDVKVGVKVGRRASDRRRASRPSGMASRRRSRRASSRQTPHSLTWTSTSPLSRARRPPPNRR